MNPPRQTTIRIALALLSIGVILFPFSRPVSDVTVTSFDPNLLAIGVVGNSPGTSVDSSGDALVISASNYSIPGVTVAGLKNSEVFDFDLRLSGSVAHSGHAEVLLWNPRYQHELIYNISLSSSYLEVLVSNKTTTNATYVSEFAAGGSYHFEIQHRLGELFRVSITNSTWHFTTEISKYSEFHDLLEKELYLTFRVHGGSGLLSLSITKFRMELLDAPPWGFRASDPRLPIAAGGLAVGILISYRSSLLTIFTLPNRRKVRLKHLKSKKGIKLGLVFAAAAIIYAYLFPLGFHIFDGPTFQRYAYIATRYGPGFLYFISHSTVLGDPANGTPDVFSGLPYPPVSVYYFTLIGALRNTIFPDSSGSLAALEYFVKGFGLMATLVLGVIVWNLARERGASENVSLALTALTLLSPALILDTAVWGGVDAPLLVPLLLGVYFVYKNRPSLAATSLFLAVLFKQTAIPAALILMLVIFRTYGPRQFLRALVAGVNASFLSLSPLFMIGLHPQTVVTLLSVPVLRQIIPDQPLHLPSVASLSAYNLYVLLSGLWASGYDRFWTPVNVSGLMIPLTLEVISRILFLLVWVIIIVVTIAAPRGRLGKFSTVAPAALIIGSVYVLTSVTGRWLILALPFLILSLFDMKRSHYLFSVSVLSVSSGFSVLQELISGGSYRPTILPFFDRVQNPIMNLCWSFLTADWLITLVSLLTGLTLIIIVQTLGQPSRIETKSA